MRFGALFVAVCMTVIAVSAGAVGFFALGFSGPEAAVVAFAALTSLALYHAVSTRIDVRSQVGPQLGELSRGNADLARQLAEVGRRLAAVETKVDRSIARSQAVAEPLAAEISELGGLVNQLADTVAAHEARLTELSLAAVSAPPRLPPIPSESAYGRIKLEPTQQLNGQAHQPPTHQAAPTASPAAPSRSVDPLSPAQIASQIASQIAAHIATHASAPEAPAAPSAAAAVPLRGPMAPPALATLAPQTPAGVMPSAVAPAPMSPAAAPAPTAAAPAPAAAATPMAPAPAPAWHAPVPAEPVLDPEMQQAIRSAIAGSRIELHLQPIVTLPQRKVRYYEAMSRLRTENGDVLMAGRFIAQAELGGLMPQIDNMVVFRCVQVLRRLLLKNREVGVFCNLSTATLTDAVVFPQLLEFLEANRAIAPSLVLEFTQSGLRHVGPIENESLAALHDRGFRFSLDNVTDLRLEPRELVSRGFRFVKMPANFMLQRGGPSSDIHPADLSDLLGRFGIDLIAEKIESEVSVVDLLDYDVKFGQGFLFSPPRPVRAEALQGIGDRGDVVARDTAPTEDGPGSAAPAAPVAKPAPMRSGGIAQIARRV
jgi:cyclic-di-GMP phosphodiesterase TipF (flagellum assembly factor)